MPQDACFEYQREIDAALAELGAAQKTAPPLSAAADAAETTPIRGGDMGIRFYQSVGRLEAAQRRYRAAVRALAECRGSRSDE